MSAEFKGIGRRYLSDSAASNGVKIPFTAFQRLVLMGMLQLIKVEFWS